MNLIQFLLKASWVNLLAAAITGSMSGIGSAVSIALINHSISQITPEHPQAAQIFYQQLLPELKQRGKAVLVISHDDRYFQLADRLLKLDYGKIITS
jgi:uncharacterized membrane protein YfbV (UPF0208 family)